MEQVKEDVESYVGMLVRVSLLLVSNEFPLEVQCLGDLMRQVNNFFRFTAVLDLALLISCPHIAAICGVQYNY